MLKSKIALSALTAGSLALSGCMEMTDSERTVLEPAIGGAIICGGLTALLGGSERDAIRNAALCAAVGTVAGFAVARTKESYASKEELIAKETRIVTRQINQTRRYTASLRSQTTAYNNEARRLRAEAAAGRDTRNAAKQARDKARREASAATKQLNALREQIRVAESLYTEARRKGASSSELSVLRNRIDTLRTEERNLTRQLDAFKAAGGRF